MLYKKGEKIDLHLHSIYSIDGHYTVRDLLKMAEAENIKVVSITDHNSIAAYDEIGKMDVSKYFSGKIITGAEINVIYDNKLIECLAYNFDVNKLKSFQYLQSDKQLEVNKQIATRLMEVYTNLGLVINDKFISKISKWGPKAFYDELVSHKENLWFLRKYKINCFSDFFRNVFDNPRSRGYVNICDICPHVEEVKRIVNEAGGILVLAHPFGQYNFPHWKQDIKTIAQNRLVDGIEVIHRTISRSETRYLTRLADKCGLVKTAGSDFHVLDHMMGVSKKSGLETIIY